MNRLLTLDAMRGIAAIMVVLFHTDHRVAPAGYLAVDFFFLLSGFVLARAYTGKLEAGMSLSRFMRLRIIRLYPLFAIGLALGAIAIALGASDITDPNDIASGLAFNPLMLPSVLSGWRLFPLNPPAWSLFFELVISLLFAMALAGARTRILLFVVLCSGLGLAVSAHHREALDFGVAWATGWLALNRTIFSFVVGMLIARWHSAAQRTGWPAGALMVALLGLLAVRPAGFLYDLAFAFIAAPLLVWLGATWSPPAVLHRACAALGDMSFALYAIHYPLLWLCTWLAVDLPVPNYAWRSCFVVSAVVLAWLLHAYVDAPIRQSLGTWLRQRRGRRVVAPDGAL